MSGAVMIFGDAALTVGIASAATAMVGAAISGLTAWYGTRRKAEVDARVGEQIHEATMTERAQKVLMETIDTMREEMRRQDDEQAVAVRNLQAQIDILREDHRECLERNTALERELANLKRG